MKNMSHSRALFGISSHEETVAGPCENAVIKFSVLFDSTVSACEGSSFGSNSLIRLGHLNQI